MKAKIYIQDLEAPEMKGAHLATVKIKEIPFMPNREVVNNAITPLKEWLQKTYNTSLIIAISEDEVSDKECKHVYYSTPYGYMPCEKCGFPHPREPKIFNMKLAIDQVIEEIEFKKNSITSNSSDDRRAKGAYTDCLMILNKKRDEQISQIVNAVVWFDNTDRRPHQIEEEAKKYLKMTYNI